ncbi:MAG: hypothetical protein PHP01_02700 [Phycisphaerae bacterium]|nr:hypothetical protein [Phycisphaerae bacterium]
MNRLGLKNPVFFICLLLTALTAIVYWQVHEHDFVFADDPAYITNNPNVQNGITVKSIIWAFTTGHTGYSHPLTWLSHMLDYQLFGVNAGGHHLVSLFFHIANTLLLFILLRKMTDRVWPSFFVAAAFALHPAHIESVAWIAERKDVLSTLFFLLTLLTYTAYVQRQTKLRYISVLLLYALGLLSKPMLVTLPFVLLLLDYWPLGRFGTAKRKKTNVSRKSFGYLVWEKLPLFGLAAGLSALTFYLQKITGTVVRPDVLPLQVRFFNAMISYGRYIAKFFWPAKLSFLYPYPPLPLPVWQIVVSVAILAGVSVFVLKFHRQKYLFVGWFWFLGILVPVIGFIQVGVQAMADRYTYVSYIGLSIMVAWGMSDLLANRKHGKAVLTSAMFIAITAMSASAYLQIGYWKNSITLSSHAAEVTQNKLIAHLARNNMAWTLATCPDPNMRNPSEAIRIAEELGRETNYNNPAVLDTLGAAYASAGRFAEAIEITQKALNLVDKNDEYTLGQFQRHLDFYKVSKPYIEPAQTPR